MNRDPFVGLYSLADAAALWGRADATLRQAIQRGKLVKDIDVKLFGKQWVVTEEAMRREYGEPKQVISPMNGAAPPHHRYQNRKEANQMPKYWAFVSNVGDFKGAVQARTFSGPLETCYSTPSIEIELCHPIGVFNAVEAAFPEHRVYQSGTIYAYVYDENGNEVPADKLVDP